MSRSSWSARLELGHFLWGGRPRPDPEGAPTAWSPRLRSSRVFLCLLPVLLLAATGPSTDFTQSIRPVLAENCGMCHNPGQPRNPANFLKAQTAKDIEADRGLWHNVAAQLRNRTMPPIASKLTEEDRLRIATWIDNDLRQTACSGGDYAGASAFRRLNRREYRNTIRDLLGVDFDVSQVFPADGTGGSGFDTNGETLYVPPVLMERYMAAAQQILDRVIVTPPLAKSYTPAGKVAAGAEYDIAIPVYLDGDYTVVAAQEGTDTPAKLILKVDGVVAGNLAGRNSRGTPVTRLSALSKATIARNLMRLQVRLTRGEHTLSLGAGDAPAGITSVTVDQVPEAASPEKRALHYRLLGTEPGEQPLQPRKAARQVLASFLSRAFRRPVEPSEIDRFMVLFDRSAQRGDPYTESVKLALRGVLVWPDFLFRLEKRNPTPGIYPLSQYELATRLSYFLWSTVPDDQLMRLADQGRLQDPAVLTAQVERMLDDPRSRAFVGTFVGQWLGTQDLGGRVAPLLTELQSYYTPEVAADLRAEPILLFDYILGGNRSLIELLDADYTFLTGRLVKFYQLEGKVDVPGNVFKLVKWPDNRRAGVIEMGSVLAHDVALRADESGAARRVGAGNAIGHAGSTSAAQRAATRSGQEAQAAQRPAKAGTAPRQSAVRSLPQADGPDRFRAGEFRLDGPLAREGVERPAAGYVGRIAVGREVHGTGGAAAGAAQSKGRFSAPSYRQDAGLCAGPQFAGWRQLHGSAPGGRSGEGRLSRAHADTGNRVERRVPEYTGRGHQERCAKGCCAEAATSDGDEVENIGPRIHANTLGSDGGQLPNRVGILFVEAATRCDRWRLVVGDCRRDWPPQPATMNAPVCPSRMIIYERRDLRSVGVRDPPSPGAPTIQ